MELNLKVKFLLIKGINRLHVYVMSIFKNFIIKVIYSALIMPCSFTNGQYMSPLPSMSMK